LVSGARVPTGASSTQFVWHAPENILYRIFITDWLSQLKPSIAVFGKANSIIMWMHPNTRSHGHTAEQNIKYMLYTHHLLKKNAELKVGVPEGQTTQYSISSIQRHVDKKEKMHHLSNKLLFFKGTWSIYSIILLTLAGDRFFKLSAQYITYISSLLARFIFDSDTYGNIYTYWKNFFYTMRSYATRTFFYITHDKNYLNIQKKTISSSSCVPPVKNLFFITLNKGLFRALREINLNFLFKKNREGAFASSITGLNPSLYRPMRYSINQENTIKAAKRFSFRIITRYWIFILNYNKISQQLLSNFVKRLPSKYHRRRSRTALRQQFRKIISLGIASGFVWLLINLFTSTAFTRRQQISAPLDLQYSSLDNLGELHELRRKKEINGFSRFESF
jgi:hypothetical protein